MAYQLEEELNGANGQEQEEEEQQEQQKNPKLPAKPKRILVAENIKRSDIVRSPGSSPGRSTPNGI